MKRIQQIFTDLIFARFAKPLCPLRFSPLYLFISLYLFSCSDEKRVEVKHSNLILGLASTISLPVESPAEINLNDFVLELERLDSVTIQEPFSVNRQLSTNNCQLTWSGEIPPISELKLWSDGIASSIILIRSKKEAVELTYSGEAESVQVAGEFTSWSTKDQDFEKDGENWTRTLYLDPGLYQYQIVVNDKWILDPANPDSVDNNVGGFNSLLTVGGLEQE